MNGFLTYDFQLLFNTFNMPNSPIKGAIRHFSNHKHSFDLDLCLKVKGSAINGFLTCDFLFMFNTFDMPNLPI